MEKYSFGLPKPSMGNLKVKGNLTEKLNSF